MSLRFSQSTDASNPPTRREVLKVVVVTVLAIIGVTAFARLYGISAGPAMQIVVTTLFSAVAAMMLGAVVLYLCRRRSVGSQAGLLFVVAGCGAALSAWINARRMFLSQHDLGVLMIVLVITGAVASYGAIAFGRRVNNSVARLISAARAVTTSGTVSVSGRNAPHELARLAKELEAMSQRLNAEQIQSDQVERSTRELVAWITGDVENCLLKVEAIAAQFGAEVQAEVLAQTSEIRHTVADAHELLKGENVRLLRILSAEEGIA